MATSIDDLTVDLFKSRLLRTDEEIETFESSLESLFAKEQIELVYNMCVGFDDRSEQFDVTYNVLHSIEYFFKKNPVAYFNQIFKVLSDNLLDPHAIEWREKIIKRIINNEKGRSIFLDSLPQAPVIAKGQVKKIALELIARNPDQFKESASQVLLFVD